MSKHATLQWWWWLYYVNICVTFRVQFEIWETSTRIFNHHQILENGFSKIFVGINLRECCGTIIFVHEHKNVCVTYDLKLLIIVCSILLIEAITISLLVSSFSRRLLRTCLVRAWDQRLRWYPDIKDPHVPYYSHYKQIVS